MIGSPTNRETIRIGHTSQQRSTIVKIACPLALPYKHPPPFLTNSLSSVKYPRVWTVFASFHRSERWKLAWPSEAFRSLRSNGSAPKNNAVSAPTGSRVVWLVAPASPIRDAWEKGSRCTWVTRESERVASEAASVHRFRVPHYW
jgi:hypothetical protein